MIPIEIGALGMIPENLSSGMEDLYIVKRVLVQFGLVLMAYQQLSVI